MEYIPVFSILIAALGFLIFSKVPADAVGLGVIVLLIVTGTASTTQALAGFAHPATLTVASVLLLSAGIQRTGVVDGLAIWMRRFAGRSENRFLRVLTLVVAPMSAFISNTAVVAVFLPMVLHSAREKGWSASRLLMPLSYASLLGGTITVIGTSTNIVVANLAEDHGLAPMGMFEFAPIGLVLVALGFLYIVFVLPRVMPDRRHPDDLSGDYHLRRYLTEVEIAAGSHLSGRTLEGSGLSSQYDLDVLEIHRGDTRISPSLGLTLHEKDVLIVQAPVGALRRIQEAEGVRLRSEDKIELSDLIGGGMVLAEAVVPPGSLLLNRTLQQSSFRNRFGITALAIYHSRQVISEKVGKVAVGVGDVLLLYGSRTRLKELAAYPEVLSVVHIHPPRPRRRLGLIAVGIIAAAVLAATVGWISLVKAVVLGAALMIISGCLTFSEAFRSVDRRTIFLLAGMIALGLSMERTGAASFFARHVIEGASWMGPTALLIGVYVVSALLTEVLTNNACAVIMTPIAVVTARDFGLDPRAFVFVVAYAASASFLTPIGYQTNLFVYGPGGYRFSDFARVGWPLSLMCAVVVLILAPLIWPLRP